MIPSRAARLLPFLCGLVRCPTKRCLRPILEEAERRRPSRAACLRVDLSVDWSVDWNLRRSLSANLRLRCSPEEARLAASGLCPRIYPAILRPTPMVAEERESYARLPQPRFPNC